MTEREALLRAVCENPDDDTPRLVFADWLDENGEEARAEFIRASCEFEPFFFDAATGTLTDPRGLALGERVRQLEAAHEARWLAELTPTPRSHAAEGEPGYRFPFWSRGFVCNVEVRRSEPFLTDWPALLAFTPIQHVGICCPLSVSRLLTVAHIRQVQAFEFDYGCELSVTDLDALLNCERLRPDVSITIKRYPGEHAEPALRERFGDRVHFWSPDPGPAAPDDWPYGW